ncbi:MAG: flavodoxin family protein [Ruminococcaceae bacterium]|nr:flavodoxin family protein [Oscillospiraceae bacterium]
MKVLLVNGSPHEFGCTYTALSEVSAQLKKNGIETEILWLGYEPLRSCIGCRRCKDNRCVFAGDVVQTAQEKMETCDGIIVGSPVHYAGPSGQVTSFLGRLFYSGSALLQGKPAASVVSCRRGGASAAYESLNKYFQMSNMPLVTSQYWNSVHGNTPDEVKKDLEGLQTMRTLADNMAWLLHSIEAGREAGVAYPIREEKVRTNFIR